MQDPSQEDKPKSQPRDENEFRTFVTDEDLEALKQERNAFALTNEAQGDRLLLEQLPLAILSLGHLAQGATQERVRLSAAQYIIDRNLGKITEQGSAKSKDPLEMLIASTVVDGNIFDDDDS